MLHNSCLFLWSSDSLCVEKTSTNKQPFQAGQWKMGPWKMNLDSNGGHFPLPGSVGKSVFNSY